MTDQELTDQDVTDRKEQNGPRADPEPTNSERAFALWLEVLACRGSMTLAATEALLSPWGWTRLEILTRMRQPECTGLIFSEAKLCPAQPTADRSAPGPTQPGRLAEPRNRDTHDEDPYNEDPYNEEPQSTPLDHPDQPPATLVRGRATGRTSLHRQPLSKE